jgi:hypothetical protein
MLRLCPTMSSGTCIYLFIRLFGFCGELTVTRILKIQESVIYSGVLTQVTDYRAYGLQTLSTLLEHFTGRTEVKILQSALLSLANLT